MQNTKNEIKKLGYLYINCTYKNTLINLVAKQSNKFQIVLQTSSKRFNQKSNSQNKNYGLNRLCEEIETILKDKKMIFLRVYLTGIGPNRLYVPKRLLKNYKILTIIDKTPIPFNGCRAKKSKRL